MSPRPKSTETPDTHAINRDAAREAACAAAVVFHKLAVGVLDEYRAGDVGSDTALEQLETIFAGLAHVERVLEAVPELPVAAAVGVGASDASH